MSQFESVLSAAQHLAPAERLRLIEAISEPGDRTGRRQDAEMQQWREQSAYFESLRLSLWQDAAYRNKYVAIRQRTVVDVDDDKFGLAQRVRQKFAGDVVFIGRVQEAVPVVELPSPEIGP